MKKETQTIEFKQSWHDEYLEWICGYANAYGGTLYIGRADDGTPVGVVKAKSLMEHGQRIKSRFLPFGAS